MSIVLAISLAVLAGFGIRRIMSRCSGPVARAIAFSASVAAVAIDLSPKLELQPVWLHPPSIYSAIAADPNAVIAEFPFETKYPWVTSNVQYMYFSLWHWRPLLNGYSGFTSREYDDFVMQLADFPGPTSLKALRRRGATHVSVNCAFMSTPCQPLLDRIELSGIFVRSPPRCGSGVRCDYTDYSRGTEFRKRTQTAERGRSASWGVQRGMRRYPLQSTVGR